ncbi:hypothetical protein [Stenotrophomonas nitritireducens]|uniref:hypothetical protein n=1 Tax=Stenotrophomonas nitritireducens TaxID=83617 RepID=UPI003D9980CD
MRKYDNLLSTIEAYFSAEEGASPETISVFEERLNQNSLWRENLRDELIKSFDDPDFSWKQALWDEYCHVTDEASEGAAKNYVVENVLRRIDQMSKAAG